MTLFPEACLFYFISCFVRFFTHFYYGKRCMWEKDLMHSNWWWVQREICLFAVDRMLITRIVWIRETYFLLTLRTSIATSKMATTNLNRYMRFQLIGIEQCRLPMLMQSHFYIVQSQTFTTVLYHNSPSIYSSKPLSVLWYGRIVWVCCVYDMHRTAFSSLNKPQNDENKPQSHWNSLKLRKQKQ